MNFKISVNGFLNSVAKALPFLAFTVIACLLWLPFGLQIGFFADDWPVFSIIQSGGLFMSGIRPFLLFPWFVAYHLDPNSFAGVNLFLWFLILGKGVISYLILSDLDFDKLFAFGTALLVLVYPADTGMFYMGGLTIHGTVFTFLLSVWLVVRFWKSGRLWLWVPIWISAAICLGSYEAVFPLFLIVPAILVYKQRGITRRVVAASLAWLLMPLIFGLRILFVVLTETSVLSYQNYLLAGDRSLGALVASIGRAIRYILVDSWINAFDQTIAPSGWAGLRNGLKTILASPYLIYTLIAVFVVLFTIVAIRRYSPKVNISIRGYIGVALAGIAMIILAFLPFTLSNLRDQNLRTLLHASQGAALTLSTCVWLVGSLLRRIKFVYVTLLTLLIIAGMTSLLYQHQSYVKVGQSQIPFMKNLVQIAPQFAPDSVIVIVDDTPDHKLALIFNELSFYLQGVLQVVYSDPTLTGIICYPDDHKPWGYNDEACHFEADGVKISYVGNITLSWRYDQIIVFRYNAQDGLQLNHDISSYVMSAEAQENYIPDSHVNVMSALSLRAVNMLGLNP